jgi:hypothetical protein
LCPIQVLPAIFAAPEVFSPPPSLAAPANIMYLEWLINDTNGV